MNNYLLKGDTIMANDHDKRIKDLRNKLVDATGNRRKSPIEQAIDGMNETQVYDILVGSRILKPGSAEDLEYRRQARSIKAKHADDE